MKNRRSIVALIGVACFAVISVGSTAGAAGKPKDVEQDEKIVVLTLLGGLHQTTLESHNRAIGANTRSIKVLQKNSTNDYKSTELLAAANLAAARRQVALEARVAELEALVEELKQRLDSLAPAPSP